MATTPYYLRKADGSYLLLTTGGRLILDSITINDTCFFDAPIEDRVFVMPAETRAFDVPLGDWSFSVAAQISAFDVPAESRTFDVPECA